LEDIKKLLLIALFSGPVAFAGCGLLYLVFWIVWSHFEPRRASQWFKTWADVLCIVPLILWALAFFVLLAAWLVEMWNKHWPPAYGPADPNNGLMGPVWGLVRSIRSMGLLHDPMQDRYNRLFGDERSLREFIEQTVEEFQESEEL